MTQESQTHEVWESNLFYYVFEIQVEVGHSAFMRSQQVFLGSEQECEVYCELMGVKRMSAEERLMYYAPSDALSVWR